MGQVLSAPIRSQLFQKKGSDQFMVGASEMQGYRMNMEDAMTIDLSLENHKNFAYFGVYDGHAGEKASLYLEEHLYKRVDALEDLGDDAAVSKCVQDFDAEFLSDESRREDGSTCCFAVVKHADLSAKEKKWEVMVSNVGDSRAVIIRKDGKCVPLTEDHKPETPEEEKRINDAGGIVQMNRVDGQLAMSRAIGDYHYKQDPKLKMDEQKVIAVPDVTREVCYEGDMLLVCCDGIVEQMTNEEAAECVHVEAQTEKDPAVIMSKLLDYSLAKGSKDNHSSMLILFKDGNAYHQDKPEFMAGPFHPWQHDQAFVKAYTQDAKKHGYEGDELMAMAQKTEDGMPELKNQPRQQPRSGGGPPGAGGMGGLLEAIMTQPGQESMKEKLMMLTSMLQQGGGAPDGVMEDEEDDEGKQE
jgi:serine/threonine protein phosphatase PrpC